MTESLIVACTVNKPLARLIQYFDVGEGHMALVRNYGQSDEYWIDSRGIGGVKEREPEKDLHSAYYLLLPWDIEPGVRQFIGRPYNYRGVIARALHFRWYDPNAMYCDELMLAGTATPIVGRPVCDVGVQDKVTPITALRLFAAYIRGMGLTPISWPLGQTPRTMSYGN